MNTRQKKPDSQGTIQRFYDHYVHLTAILHQQFSQIPDPLIYTQIVLNRVIFLRFLQSTELIHPNMLQTLFQQAQARKQNFFQVYFLPLCFLCLNIDPKQRDPQLPSELRDLIYIPGELFARDDFFEAEPSEDAIRQKKLTYLSYEISNDCWSEIFEVLATYQWSIIEQHSPTVITPEILGYIFEKTIDQHDTGSYYTPKKITTYICREAIETYLTRRINAQFTTNYGNIKTEITEKTNLKPESRPILLHLYFELLKKLTICDNACGTGAFLVAAVEVLADLIQKIYLLLQNLPEFAPELERIRQSPNPAYFIKSEILRNNIYGVDLQTNALEIAKARLWLALLATITKSENPIILPLPNLEFHLRVGNSLIGGFTEQSLEEPLSPNLLAQINQYHDLIRQYTQLNTVSSSMRHEILTLHHKLNAQINQVMYDSLRYLIPPIKVAAKSDGATPEHGGLARLEYLHPFHWFVEFGEVFQHGGFDILVGNPPFIRHEKVKHLGDQWHIPFKDLLKRYYTPYDSSFDLSMFFLLRSLDLLKPDGMHAYIITSKWTRARYGKLIQDHVYSKNSLIKFLDLTGIKVFVGATVDTVIYFLAKTSPNPNNSISYNHPLGIDHLDQGSYLLTQTDLEHNLWTFLPKDLQAIKNGVDQKCVILKHQHLKTYRGITTGYNKAFILSDPQKIQLLLQDPTLETLIHPVLIGEDLIRYGEQWNKSWILAIPANSTNSTFLHAHPALDAHFNSFLTLARTGKGRGLKARDDQGAFWWELRPCDYYHQFLQPKLVWQRVTQEPRFYLDIHGMFLLDSTACLRAPLHQLKYLQVILSSKFIRKFFVPHFVHQYGDSGFLLSNQYVERMPICPIDDPSNYEILSDYLSFLHHTQTDVSNSNLGNILQMMEEIADLMVYELYSASSTKIAQLPLHLRLQPLLLPIPFDIWSQLCWKMRTAPITSTDQTVLSKFRSTIEQTLRAVFDCLISDPQIQTLKVTIQNSSWVHAIESQPQIINDSN